MALKKNAPPPAHSQIVRTFINGKVATEVVSLARKDKGRALRRVGAPVVGNTNRVEKARSHGLPALARARKRAEKEKGKGKGEGEDEAAGEGERAAVSVPTEAVGMIIGRGGRSIREMQNKTGCKISVPGQARPGQADQEIELAGSRDAINQAKAAIEEKVEAAKQESKNKGEKSGPRLGAHDTTVGK